MDLGLKEKVALVLAASKGQGRTCTAALAAQGAVVTTGAHNRQILEETAQEIQQKVEAVPWLCQPMLREMKILKELLQRPYECLGI